MTYDARILESANRELDQVVAYLASYDKAAAHDFLDEFEKQLDLICSGTVEYRLSRMPELAQLGYRIAFVGRYLFLYYLEDEMVVVAHVFHQRQDYARLVGSKEAGEDRADEG